ncbi:MAG: glycosyltransferase [Geobacter sp.]|nr:glycosyltransferase [Geobacter sp.]
MLDGWFAPLLNVLKEHADIGIVAPKLIFPDHTIQHCGKVWQEIESPRSQPQHIYYKAPADHPAVNKSRDYQMVTAACILLRRAEFYQVGCFDEGYDNGWEDDDLCYAYLSIGKRVFYCAESTIIHHQSRTLNEKIRDLEKRLPDGKTLGQLNAVLADSSVTAEQRREAKQTLSVYAALEEELVKVRSRFNKNRSRFFSKWGDRIVRDDCHYYESDGLVPSPVAEPRLPLPVSSTAKASIIIPLFNKAEYTRRCLETLKASTPAHLFELILVDNGSNDETGALLDAQSASVKVIRNEQNLGFAHACNQGAAAADTPYLLFLNNDTEPFPGWLEPLIDLMDNDSRVAATGCKLLFPDNTIQHAGVVMIDDQAPGGDPLVAKHLYYGKPADFPAANRAMHYQALTAAALMVRNNIFQEVGGFDERYWNGYEDVDLCLKLQQQGYFLIYVPTSVLIHHESKSGPERFVKVQHNIEQLHANWLGKVSPDFIVTSDNRCLETSAGIVRPYIPPPCSVPSIVAAPDPSLVSMVILTYNQLDYTKQCLESIRRHTRLPHEIIFVDNASSDGTVEWLQQQSTDPTIRTILNDQNLGFAAGCNQGMRAARGAYILLLNNDVIVTPEWLSGMLECLRLTERGGIVGPMTNNISGIQRLPEIGYSSLDALDSFAEAFHSRYHHRRIPSRRIVGFSMLFRRTLMDTIGLLDERFGSGNFEDDDYCIRASLAGFRNVIAGDVFIHHHGSASFTGNKIDISAAMAKNHALFSEKWSKPVTDPDLSRQIVTLKTLEKVDLLFQRGEFSACVDTILKEGIACIPGEHRFYTALAHYLLEEGDYSSALQALDEHPDDQREELYYSLRATALLGLERLDEASTIVRDLLIRFPGSPRSLSLMGAICLTRSEFQDAENFFRQAIAADPGYGPAYTQLALLPSPENPDKNFDLFEQAFVLSPTDTFSLTNYHSAVSESARYDRAIPLFREACRLFPNHKRLRFLLIDLLMHHDEQEKALQEIEDVIVLFGATEGLLSAGLQLRESIGPLTISQDVLSSVTLCMIVKNEEPNLPRCLQSLKPIVDEMVIVDTGSTDLTAQIAQMFGAQVISFPWNGNFSDARNASLDAAHGDWILVMDADEIISSRDYDRFRALIANTPHDTVAYEIETRNYMGKVNLENWHPNEGIYLLEEAGAGWTPSGKVRLFPRHPKIRFENPIHELVDETVVQMRISIQPSDIPVHHYGYLDEARQKAKGEHYYELGKRKLAESGGEDFKALCELAVQAGGVGRYDEALRLWQTVVQKAPDYPLAFFNMGYVLLQLGRFTEAAEACKKALDLDPDYSEVITNFAMCLLCLGNTQKALQLVEKSLHTHAQSPTLLLMLGTTKLCAGDSVEGLKIYQDLTEKRVVFSDFINDAVTKLLEGKQEECALKVLEAAIKTHAVNEQTEGLLKELAERQER